MSRRILSVSGGGIFGLIPALVLQEIEARTGKACADIFDLIAGTSTGGIIACGLVARVPASRLVDLYENHGAAIFDASLGRDIATVDGINGPKYSALTLESLLQAALGTCTLRGVGGPKLLVPTSRCNLAPTAFWFKSWDGPDFLLWQVARATSAAPYYFPVAVIGSMDGQQHICADGGLFANNPEDYATGCAQDLWPREDLSMLSLGTGRSSTLIPAKPDWGVAEWLPSLIGLILQNQEEVTEERMSLTALDRTRLDPLIGGAMDDVSPANIVAMKAAAAEIIAGPAFAAYVTGLGGA